MISENIYRSKEEESLVQEFTFICRKLICRMNSQNSSIFLIINPKFSVYYYKKIIAK